MSEETPPYEKQRSFEAWAIWSELTTAGIGTWIDALPKNVMFFTLEGMGIVVATSSFLSSA